MDLTTPDLLHGAILAALFVAIAFWEQSRPDWHTTVPAGRRWLVNLGLYALCTGAAFALAPLRTAAAGFTSSVALIPSFPETTLGIVVHFAAMLLALDLIDYLGHRLVHVWGVAWRVHAIHHTDLDLDVTTTMRHHPVEVFFFTAIVAGVGALLNATPGELVAYGALAFGVQLVAHANLALPAGLESSLGRLLVTPAFHRLHHSRDKHECDANYGEVFVLWDRLFGTAVTPSTQTPTTFGVDQYLASRYQTLGWILLQPALAMPSSTATETHGGQL